MRKSEGIVVPGGFRIALASTRLIKNGPLLVQYRALERPPAGAQTLFNVSPGLVQTDVDFCQCYRGDRRFFAWDLRGHLIVNPRVAGEVRYIAGY